MWTECLGLDTRSSQETTATYVPHDDSILFPLFPSQSNTETRYVNQADHHNDQITMNAQAGPSRARLSRTIDLSTINIDKTIPQSFSSTSIAPSLSTHRSSTQSTEGWGALHTPRLDRLSLSFSECSIDEDDVVVFGQGREGKDRSIDSVMLDEARTGYWVDLVSLTTRWTEVRLT